jgi:Na+-transporting NADH:ubiquinone oxidoreductase subunit D|tara:strand:- start:62 stop:748 length:687 start_codon:yes stop_codon:yes gene_type:complete
MNLKNYRDVIIKPLIDENPITLQILGICSALAVTNNLSVTLVMCVAVTTVLSFSNLFISLIRNYIPSSIRIIVQMTIIASLVIVVDELLKAYDYETSKKLSVFVGLIITNCIVMGRAEAFAMKEKPLMSFLDGLGNGLGYSLILIGVAAIRELFGAGTLFDYEVFRLTSDGGWYMANNLLLLPPSSFIIIGLFIWLIRSIRPKQVEVDDFELSKHSTSPDLSKRELNV